MSNTKVIIAILSLLIPLHTLHAETLISIFHTSDIHGHFSNTDSPMKLGGVARLKYKMDQLKKKNQNHILLDSGDWTEGTIFYTLNSGEANHRLMESFGYDAIVLGNHEWLVGPEEMYQGFVAADFKVPVLGANIQFDKIPLDIPLQNYIKPYLVKEIGGVRVGILGLSTFEIIYDPFLEPGQINDPIRVATRYVKHLREQENCQVVILLTHTGLRTDKNLAQSVPGIDLIVGGHTHILTPRPIYVNGIPIVHTGYWAQYLGEYGLLYKDGKTQLVSHKVHQIDETLPEDFSTKTLIQGFEKRVIEKFGNIFDDKIVRSDVFLPLDKTLTENTLANWAVDAIAQSGGTSLALDVGQYYRRDLFAGFSSTVDFFNLFPHVYSNKTQKSWTIYNMEIRGSTMKQLINIFSKLNLGVKISGGSYRIDGEETLSSIKDFNINQKPLESSKFYKISATRGVLVGLEYLKIFGADIGIRKIKDTGLEAWRAIKSAVQAQSPITAAKTRWEGRVRTLQPDVHIPVEQIHFSREQSGQLKIHFTLLNAGISEFKIPSFHLKVDISPKDSLDEKWVKLMFPEYVGKTLKGGKSIQITTTLDVVGWPQGVYPVDIESLPVPKEINEDNNKAQSYFNL